MTDREDLVHEVFLKVHSRLADYDDSRPLRPWLFGFAYRVAADYHRLARHRVEVLGAQGEAAAETVPADERIASLEQRDLVLFALNTIDLDRRAVDGLVMLVAQAREAFRLFFGEPSPNDASSDAALRTLLAG